MSEKSWEEMDINLTEDLILNISNSSHSTEDHSLFLRENENNSSHLDDSTSQKNLGREWGEDILRSFAVLDHENIENFGKGNNSLIGSTYSIPCARSPTLPSSKSALVVTSIRQTKKSYKIISLMQGRKKNLASILATKKVKIALKRLRRTTEKTRSLRVFKYKQNIQTNHTHAPIHLERPVKVRDLCQNSKIKQNEGEIEEYYKKEEMSGNLCSNSEMKLYQSQRRRGNTESLEKCEANNHVTPGLAYSVLIEADDTKSHFKDANMYCTESGHEISYIVGDTSKSLEKVLPTDVSITTPKNAKRNHSNTVLMFSIDKSTTSLVGGRSKVSHSQKLLHQSKLFLINRSARFSQEHLSHPNISADKELFPNVENEECCEALPSSTEKIRTKCETELDSLDTIISSEIDENPSNVLLVGANTTKEKLQKAQQKQCTNSNFQEVTVDIVNTSVENKNILPSSSKMERMKVDEPGDTRNELEKTSNSALGNVAELSPPSRCSTSNISPKISRNLPYFKKAKTSRSQSLREKKTHKKTSDDCNDYYDKSPDSSSGIIRKTEENFVCEEVGNESRSKPSVTECSEDKRKEPCSYKNERSCRYFLRNKAATKTESEALVTSEVTNSETGSNSRTSQVHEIKDKPSCRIENQNEKRKLLSSRTTKSNFSTKTFPQTSFLPNDSAQQKQEECKSTILPMNLEEKSKKKNTRKRKLWSQSSSFEDIQEQEVTKTPYLSPSHEGTCRSHVNKRLQTEKRKLLSFRTTKSNFSTKTYPQTSFLPNDSAQQKQEECKSTILPMNLEEKSKKKNTRKRKLWSQSSSFEDIQEQEVTKTPYLSPSHEGTCRSHVNKRLQNATNTISTLHDIDSEKEGNVVKKCNLQHVSNRSQKDVVDYSLARNISGKMRLLIQQQDAKEINCVVSEEASSGETSNKIQEILVKQQIADEKDSVQENPVSSQQYCDGRNRSFSPRIYSGNETVEVCISKEKEILKETHNSSALREEDNQTSCYTHETTTLSSRIQKGNEKLVLNSNDEPNTEQITPNNIASEISPDLLRSITVRPKIINKNSHLDSSIVKTVNGSTSQKPSGIEGNNPPSVNYEHFKTSQDLSTQLSGVVEINSEVKETLQENVKNNDGMSMDTIHPVSEKLNNHLNKGKLLKSQTNQVIRDATSSPLKENMPETHDQSQKMGACSFDPGMSTNGHCVSVYPHHTARSKTLIIKRPSVIPTTNFEMAGEMNMSQATLYTKSDCEFLNGIDEIRELFDLNVIDFAANTDSAESVISPHEILPQCHDSLTIKNVQEISESRTNWIHNSLAGTNDENVWIPGTEHVSENYEQIKNTLLSSRTVSHSPTESRNKCEEKFNSRDPVHCLRSNAIEAEGILNRVSDSRNCELPDVFYRPEGAENISQTSRFDSTKDITNSSNQPSLVLNDSRSMSSHNKSGSECFTRERIHNALGHSPLDSEMKNKSHSKIISKYSELFGNWNPELKVKRRLTFQQNPPGVATCDTKITSTSSSDVVIPQDDEHEKLGITVSESNSDHKEVLDSFIRILTKNGAKTYVITCFSPEDKKQTKEENWQDLQENASDTSGKDKMSKEPSTTPCKAIVSNGENEEMIVENQNSENAFSETSKVNEETQDIPHQDDLFLLHDKKSTEPDHAVPCVKRQGSEYDKTILSERKSEFTSEERQDGELNSCKCDTSNIQNESKSSAKAVRNKKGIRKTSRCPYMLRNTKREENDLSLQIKKKRQFNNKSFVKLSGLHDQNKSLQNLSHPSFLLTEIMRIARSPYLLRNRKISGQHLFSKHSKQTRTVRKVDRHSVNKPCMKSDGNNYDQKDDIRKKRSPYMLRKNERRKSCNNSSTKNKREICRGNKINSAPLYPTSRVKKGNFVSSILSTLATISRSQHLYTLERKTFQHARKFDSGFQRSRPSACGKIRSKQEEVERASPEKIQNGGGSQIASGVPVQRSAVDTRTSVSKEDEREIENEDKQSTSSTYYDWDCQTLPESIEHKISTHGSSEVEKYKRTLVTESIEDETLSYHHPHHVNTMMSKGEETLSKSHPVQARSLDKNPRIPIFKKGRSENAENDVNDLNSDKSALSNIAMEPVQISSNPSALEKSLFQTSLVHETSETLLPQLSILVDRNFSEEAEKDNSSSGVGKQNVHPIIKKDTPPDTNIYCSSSANCEKNIETSEVNECIKSFTKENQNPPNWSERKHEETPLSSKLLHHTLDYTFSKGNERSIQYLCSPFLKQCHAGRCLFPGESSKAQERKRVNKNVQSVTSAHSNIALHSEEESSGSNNLEQNVAHSCVHSHGRNKSSFEGSCWLNDEIRKLFPIPQCLDESRNRIMSSSTFIWLCSEKKSRDSRFPLLKKIERTKSKKIAEKKRGWTLSNNILGESHSVSDGERKKMKPKITEKKNEEKNEKHLCSKYLKNQIKNRVSAKKLVMNNEKADVFRTRQELQNMRGNENTESYAIIKKRISLESNEHLLSSAKGKYLFPESETRKNNQKLLHSPVDKGVIFRILPCSQASKFKSMKHKKSQEEVMKQEQRYAEAASVKVRNLKISKKVQKVKAKVLLKKSANSRRLQALANKHCEEYEKFPEVLQTSFQFTTKRKSKKSGMPGSRMYSGYTGNTSSITKVTDSNLLVGDATNEGGNSLKGETEHSENSHGSKVHEREAVECQASVADRYQDAIKLLKHMHSTSYSAAKMSSKKHISSSYILTRLINDSKLQANRCEINNGTSTADKLASELPTKKGLTRKLNSTSISMTNGYESENLNVLHSFTLSQDCNNANETKRQIWKSRPERNASQGSIVKENSVNRSLGKREAFPTIQEGKRKRLLSFPSLTRNGILKRKKRIGSCKLKNENSSHGNAVVTNAMNISHATSQSSSTKSTKNMKSESLSSSDVSPQEACNPVWSPLSLLASRTPSSEARLRARSALARRQERALDLLSPDRHAFHRAVERAKRQLASRAPPPPPPPPPARARLDAVTRRLWNLE